MPCVLVRKNKKPASYLIRWWCSVTLFAEIIQMLIPSLQSPKPFEQSYALVSDIAAPMIIANSVGAALFMIIQDRKTILRNTSDLRAAHRPTSPSVRWVFSSYGGFTSDNAQKIVRIIYEETNVGAVAITDREKFAFGWYCQYDEHHNP
ncbi:hypothetical protein OK016_12325 [Vibrio chagasii]|nr:hypothetical protein [Vibrio chagasii]